MLLDVHCMHRCMRQVVAQLRKSFSTSPNPFPWWPAHPGVVLSRSNNPFTNLALEDWIYQRCDWSTCSNSSSATGLATSPPLLMLWRNSPCVVIGRHQNPWSETASLGVLAERGVALVRRNSGGGTVFHDMGNLNCTFFSSREAYNRRLNLQLICEAIGDAWGVDVSVSDREDILLDSFYKISGTAAKLGRTSAYHHCTILCDVDTSSLSHLLSGEPPEGFESKATRSVKSWVKNLKDAKSSISCDALTDLLGNHFLKSYGLADGSVSLVEPTETNFPGLAEIETKFRSWDWIFGKCPQFSIESRASVPPDLRSRSLPFDDVLVKLKVQQGCIREIVVCPDHWLSSGTRRRIDGSFVGKQFPHRTCRVSDFDLSIDDSSHDSGVKLQTQFLCDIILKCMKSVL